MHLFATLKNITTRLEMRIDRGKTPLPLQIQNPESKIRHP
jgi:hypothetical protein